MNIFRKPRAVREPHVHVFDSEVGIDQVGPYTILKCSCGLGRVFSATRMASVNEYLRWRKEA
jgi:hypothetical protein